MSFLIYSSFYLLMINTMTHAEEVKEFSPKKLTNANYGAFMQAFEKLVAKGTTEKLWLEASDFTAFQDKLKVFLDLNQEMHQEEFTKALQELDKKRDQLLSFIFAKISIEAQSPDTQVQKAGQLLLPLKKQYQGIQTKQDRAESFLINGLLVDLEKTEHAAAVVKIWLTAGVQELKTVNAKFIETMAERSEKEIVRNLQGAKKLREELDTLYRQFIRKIDALGVVNPNPELVACIASLNQLIQETRNARTIHKGLVGAYTTDGEWEDEEKPEAEGIASEATDKD